MKIFCFAFVFTLTAASSGCTFTERSRALNNPGVSALTTVQQVCSNCHGAGGNSTSPAFPALAGQQKVYLIAQLKAYRSHARFDPDAVAYMWGISSHLTDAQIDGLATYYAAALPFSSPVKTPADLTAGRTIYEKGIAARNVPACASCHGAAAQGAQQFPRLAGQHAAYLVKQLNIFQKTDTRPEGSIMKAVVHDLTPQDISEVARYLESLRA